MKVEADLLDYLEPEEKEVLLDLLSMLPVWMPDSRNTPQCEAFESEAFEVLYGGAAGGGKSDLLLGVARTNHRRSLLLRREFPDLERSLISRSLEFYGDRKFYNSSKHVWNIDGKRIEFGHMERIGTPQEPGDEQGYASAPYDFIGFDQLEQFTKYGYEFMISRARSADGENQSVRVVSSANWVGENLEWIIRRWAPWLDPAHPNPAKPGELRWYYRLKGEDEEREAPDNTPIWDAPANDWVIPRSRTFIPAGLQDNPYLTDDYKAALQLLPEPLRSALLYGELHATLTDDAYQVIPRAWVKAAMRRWTENPPDSEKNKPLVIGDDMARGGDDKMILASRRGNWFDKLKRYPGREITSGAKATKPLIEYLEQLHLAERTDKPLIEYKDDGISLPIIKSKVPVNVDVIGIGASAYDTARLHGINAKPINFSELSDATDKSGQLHFVNKRAEYYWKFRDALDPTENSTVALPPDPELEADLCAARWIPQTNGIKIEPKEEIKKRIGRSPDSADAVVLSWADNPMQIF